MPNRAVHAGVPDRHAAAQLAGLLSHVAAAIDRHRDGEIDACTVDETIHHYERGAAELQKFCFARGGGQPRRFHPRPPRPPGRRAETINW
jgi:hypothetical protein